MHGASRELLIDVALNLFATHGVSETSLATIARAAGATPAMVHYYFQTREHLLDVLIDERFAPLRAALLDVFRDASAEPLATLHTFAQHLALTVEQNPWFARLWMRDLISEDGLLRERMAARIGDVRRDTALERIRQWQHAGTLNPRLEPSLVFASLCGLMIVPLAMAGGTAATRLTHAQIADHALALLAHGVGVPRTD
ncbi:MAG: TetR/AcrR family transcriptional regulator [Janthinobacterium lividum]